MGLLGCSPNVSWRSVYTHTHTHTYIYCMWSYPVTLCQLSWCFPSCSENSALLSLWMCSLTWFKGVTLCSWCYHVEGTPPGTPPPPIKVALSVSTLHQSLLSRLGEWLYRGFGRWSSLFRIHLKARIMCSVLPSEKSVAYGQTPMGEAWDCPTVDGK